jgi:hypothetical protein
VSNSANFNDKRLINVATPFANNDAATKNAWTTPTRAPRRTKMRLKINSRLSDLEVVLQFKLLQTINSAIVNHLTAKVANRGSFGTLHLRNMHLIVPTNATPSDVSPRITITLYKQPLEIGPSTSIEISSSTPKKMYTIF